jgi:hypothetical protein
LDVHKKFNKIIPKKSRESIQRVADNSLTEVRESINLFTISPKEIFDLEKNGIDDINSNYANKALKDKK